MMSSWLNPSSRRVASGSMARNLYAALKKINSQRQSANVTRICNYMQRYHRIKSADCIREIESCVRDGLLICKKTLGNKGSMKGKLQETYMIPNTLKCDGYDWYCFECHEGGEVMCCYSCRRVFHDNCIDETLTDGSSCYMCRNVEDINISKEKLNLLLRYLCKDLRELVPDKLKNWKILASEKFLMTMLLYKHMDLHTMQRKASNISYNNLQEFAADAKTFLHNVTIYYGDKNSFTEDLKLMYEYCLNDIEEIKLCTDCYEASHKKTENWFCKPCRPLHKLVYAKLNNAPYWPAKVIKQFGNKYDVRFFGSRHTRAIIPTTRVIPVTPDVQYINNLPKYSRSKSWKLSQSQLINHVVCIGPRVTLERLPVNFEVSDLLQSSSNSTRTVKRKRSDDGVQKKKIRREENLEQAAVIGESSNCQPCVNTTEKKIQIRETEVSNRVCNLMEQASHSDLETASILELHEEIDIKNECVDQDTYIIGKEPIQMGSCSNGNNDGTNQSDNSPDNIFHDEPLGAVGENVTVKEEQPCLHCSSLDLISREKAEGMKNEAVAKVTRHYEEMLTRMQEHYKDNFEDFKKRYADG